MSAQARKKNRTEALPVPQDDSEANQVLATYGEAARALDDVETRMKAHLAKVKAQFEEEAAPLKAAAQGMLRQLLAFAEAHRKRLTDGGKVKTVEMPAGKLGWRTRPASTRLAPGKTDDDVIEELKTEGMRRFIRTVQQVNREALIEHADEVKHLKTIVVGSEGENFYVEPFAPELAPGEKT